MAVGLKNIAEESGFSVPTVSRVLRGDQSFSAATRERVLSVAQRLRYRPNKLVQGIQTGRSGMIGVMIPPLGEYLCKILHGVHDVLAHNDCVPLLLWTEPTLPELDQIHKLVDRRVDGVILFPHEDSAPDHYLSEVWDRGIPLVTVDRQMPNTHADFSGTDDEAGTQLVAEHLLDLGHRDFVHLTACPGISTANTRWQAFKKGIEAAPGTTLRRVVADGFHDGFEPALKLLQSRKRPTAIFAANDNLAASVLLAARELEISVPEQLSLVGYSDLDEIKNESPKLTTVRQNPHAVGRAAAKLILDRLENEADRSKPTVVLEKPELIIRESTGPVNRTAR